MSERKDGCTFLSLFFSVFSSLRALVDCLLSVLAVN